MLIKKTVNLVLFYLIFKNCHGRIYILGMLNE